MRRFLVLFVAALGVAPAAAQAPVADEPDGLLVLGVVDRENGHVERAVVADPRTGETRARRLPGGTLCHGPVMAVGDRVVYSGYRGRRAVAISLPMTLAGPPRSLGAADTITPSAAADRLWLGRWRHGRRASFASLRSPGATRVEGRLPRWSVVHAALDDGFLIGSGRRLTLWDRDLDRPLRGVRDAQLVAAGGSSFAWCGARCRELHVLSPDGERSLRPPPGIGLRGFGGAFSPDDARLAVPVTVDGAQRVAVVDLAAGDWTVVPGGGPRGYGTIAWSPLGAWLYFSGGEERLLAWAPGMAHATRVPVEPGGAVLSIATR
jgi:hypothetical protein